MQAINLFDTSPSLVMYAFRATRVTLSRRSCHKSSLHGGPDFFFLSQFDDCLGNGFDLLTGGKIDFFPLSARGRTHIPGK